MENHLLDNLEGRVAMVTGSSRGIGRAIALNMAAHGADIVVNYRIREELASEVVSLAEAMGRRALAVQADVGSPSDCEMLVESALDNLGGLDILVNNAGIWRAALVEDVEPETLERLISTNIKSAFYVTGPAVKLMKESGWGRVVNVSSVIGVTGFPGDTMYSATKAAIFGFTKSLARELARWGITVNAVVPGFIATDMALEIGQEAREKILWTIPIRRWGTVDEVAELATFLAEKGSYITGQLFTIDGGYTI